MRVAYADPPYIGIARRYPEKREVDHAELVASLTRDFPDGWALSCKANSVRDLWPLCPKKTRLAVWAKSYASVRKNVRPTYAWEGLLFLGGRRQAANMTPDWLKCSPMMDQPILGAKPLEFSFWLFRLLGLEAGDDLVDLFPGSGAIKRAWRQFQRQIEIPF